MPGAGAGDTSTREAASSALVSIQPNPSAPLWPAEWQGCTFTAQYIDFTGAAVSGSVTFTPTAQAVFAGVSRKIAVGTTITVPLDTDGALSVTLPATDDPETNPVGWTYSVVENFPGGRSYSLEAPRNEVIDLTQATPVPSSADPRGPSRSSSPRTTPA